MAFGQVPNLKERRYTFTISLQVQLQEAVRELAARERVSLSAITERMILEWLARHEPDLYQRLAPVQDG